MLEIGTICAEAGEKKTGWLEIEGGGQKLPLTLICGAKEGPTLLISAGIHGAEYIGVQALSELSRELDPRELKGNVICIHVANPSAFRDYVRFFVPEDGKNLNRVFPGKRTEHCRSGLHGRSRKSCRRKLIFISIFMRVIPVKKSCRLSTIMWRRERGSPESLKTWRWRQI